MKHKWEIKPRGKLTNYYICKVCNMTVVASSRKLANELEPFCKRGKNEIKNFVKAELLALGKFMDITKSMRKFRKIKEG